MGGGAELSDDDDHAPLGCTTTTAPDFAPFPADTFAFDEAGGVTTGGTIVGALLAAGPKPNPDATITGDADDDDVPVNDGPDDDAEEIAGAKTTGDVDDDVPVNDDDLLPNNAPFG